MMDDVRYIIREEINQLSKNQLYQLLIGIKVAQTLPNNLVDKFMDMLNKEQILISEAAERFGFTVSDLCELERAVMQYERKSI